MEKNKQDLPYDLRPSRSGPAVLKGLFPTQSSLDGVQYVIFALLFDKFLWKEYFPNLLESTLLVKIFVFLDSYLKFLLQLPFFEPVKMAGSDLT